MSQKKSILEQMYEVIMERGGPTGPITQALVDAYEGRDYTKPYEFKRVIQFRKEMPQSSEVKLKNKILKKIN